MAAASLTGRAPNAANAGVEGVALDARAGKLYWTENGNGVVRRGNFDGSNVEPVITTIAEPWGIDLYLCAP